MKETREKNKKSDEERDIENGTHKVRDKVADSYKFRCCGKIELKREQKKKGRIRILQIGEGKKKRRGRCQKVGQIELERQSCRQLNSRSVER